MKKLLFFYILSILIGAACSSPAPAVTQAPVDMPQSFAQVSAFPNANCCDDKTVQAGVYELPAWLGLPLNLEIGRGWRVLNEERARLFLFGRGRSDFDDPTQVLVFIPVPGGNPKTLLSLIKNEPGLIPAGELTEIEVSGKSGYQLDFVAKPNSGYEGSVQAEIPPGVQFLPVVSEYFTSGISWTTWTAESRLRFIALDLGGDVLLVEIESPPAEFDAFAAEAEQILLSLKLKK